MATPFHLLIGPLDPQGEQLADVLRETSHYSVETVDDAAALLTELQGGNGRYDAVLLDDYLPPDAEKSGIKLARQIRETFPAIELIFLIGRSETKPIEILRAGASHYLTKPINLEELGLILQKIYERKQLRVIANAQLLKETQQRAEQLESVRQTTLALTSNLNRESLLEMIIREAIQLLGGKSGGIDVFYPDCDCLKIVAEYGRAANSIGQTIPVGKGIAGTLVKNADPYLIVDDYYQWSQRIETFASKREFGSVLAVKLQWQDRIVGALYVDDAVGRKFTEQDAQLLRLFADHAAIALVNADYLAQDIAKLRRLEKLSQISREIMSNLENVPLDARLNLIARHAAEILQAEACSILLIKRPGYLSFEAAYGYIRGGIKKGREFAIRSGKRTGLTGHIAYRGELFNAHGDGLVNHFAAKGIEKPYVVSGQCYSMLAIPLKTKNEGGEQLIGLLRLDNKKNRDGEINPNLYFDQEDEWIANLFVNAVVAAIENAELIQQLSEQKEYRDRLILSSPSGVVANDRHGRITIFNKQAQTLLDYEPHELIGKPVSRLYANEDVPRAIGKLIHQQENKLIAHESVAISKEGERIPIRLAATWLYDVHGERIGAVGYFEDLRAIKETRRRLELLLKAGNVVAQAGNRSNGLQRLAKMIATYLDMRFCLILIADESGRFLISEAISPRRLGFNQRDQHQILGRRVAMSDWNGLSEFLTDGGATVLRVDDQWTQRFLAKLPLHLGLPAQDIQSLLALPLRAGKQVVGLLYLGESRRWQSIPFSNEKLKLAMAIADQTAVLIERDRLYENTKRREQLLATLDETSRHIRGEKETRKLWPEIVRLATKLAQCEVGGLFVNNLHLGELVLSVVHGLPNTLIGSRLPHAQGLIGQAAATGQAIVANEYGNWPNPEALFTTLNLQTIAAIPLKQAGKVQAILFVADTSSLRWVVETDLEILERFAVQASIALQTSRLMGREQRMFAQLAILHRISDYIQATDDLDKILHVVLTGITAGYGLGFNRATLIFLDEARQYFVGSMGIGHLEPSLASADWDRDHKKGLYDFGEYLDKLEKGEILLTPVGKRIQALRYPLQAIAADAFSHAALNRQCLRIEPKQFSQLPPHFLDIFEPVSPLVIAPLTVRDETIGLLIVDNKFTRAPITDEDVELLITFANTAAIAIDKIRLFHETEAARERIRSLYAASAALVLTEGPQKVLKDRIDQAKVAAGASGVSVIFLDEMGQTLNFLSAGIRPPTDDANLVQLNELSIQVLRTGKPMTFNNTNKHSERIQPNPFGRRIAAALCAPLSIGNKSIGVMWVYYDAPRFFSDSEIDALQLYANQTAVAYDSARHIKELEHMRQASEALAKVTGLPKVLEQIVKSAREVLQADAATIYSYDTFRNKFDVENSVASGIPPNSWKLFQKEGPRSGGTAQFVMEHRWVGVRDISNRQQYPFIGKDTRKPLGKIGVKSFQGVALIVDEEKLGVLYVSYKRLRSFTREERKAAQTFANHAALALKKAKLLDRVRKTQNTAKIVARVTTLENLEHTLESLVAETKNALDCDAVTLYVYNPYRNQLIYPPTMIGVRYPKRALRLPGVADDSIVWTALEREQMVIVENTDEDANFKSRRFTVDEGIQSCVAIPLRVGTESVGVMFVNYRTHHRFPADELENIELFANQAAVAIHNAQLYKREQRRTTALQALYQATNVIIGSLDLTETLHRILEQAWELVSYQEKPISYASIWLLEGESKVKLVAA
ncbi:MAG: GAF domain-containing protein, partial [Chloroflexi bacterium]|nr:GAF domain-containing protein [Chloroflexota bacterium]